MARSRLMVAIAALLVGSFVALFRIATLGGSLGGFDDDHFVHFSYAKQVQAGERPLRDFVGIGLQGAWPTLTYGASAVAQAVGGNNLQSEAFLTAGALAIAAAVTVVAASALAPPWWAATITIIGVLAAPKLYAYPKVLLIACASWLIVAYARRPRAATVVGFSMLTATAFLFRHDYAVYVSTGCTAVMAASAGRGRGRAALRDGILTATLTLALLFPSLLYVQGHRGLDNYLTDVLEESSREAARSEHVWPSFSAIELPLSEANATAVLYWLLLAMPPIGFAAAARAWSDDDAMFPVAVVALAAMMLVANTFMLRGNLAARFGDVGSVGAVLGAALAAGAPRARRRSWRFVRRLLVAAFLVVATAAVWTTGSVQRELQTAAWPAWPGGLIARARDASQQLQALPARIWTDEDARAGELVAQYINRCTFERDRVFVVSYAPEIVGLSGRLFAGGALSLLLPSHTVENDQRIASTLRSQSVPLVFIEDEQWRYTGEPFFPLVHAYFEEAYVRAGEMRVDGSRIFHVLVTRQRVPNGAFRETGLPCFR